MTSPEIMKVKALAAILEAIDADDEEDAKSALKLIKTLLGTDKGESAIKAERMVG